MKKILSMILALAMILSLSVTAFAADTTVNNNDLASGSWSKNDIGVTASYQPDSGTPTAVYAAKIEWVQNGTLQYNAGTTTYTWDPNVGGTPSYSVSTGDASWTVNEAKVTVTVTNYSNAKITASVEFAKGSNMTSVEGAWNNESYEIESAAANITTITDGATGVAVPFNFVYTISAVEGAITESDTSIGTITVTLTHD